MEVMNNKPEVIVTLNEVEAEIISKTEKLYDTLDKYVQSSDDWVQIDNPPPGIPQSGNQQPGYPQPESLQSENPSFTIAAYATDGNDLSETSTAESFHFISPPEASEAETQQLNNEATTEPVIIIHSFIY